MSDDFYGWPYFNPEVVEAECYPVEFPVEHDIEYIGGIRTHRVTEFKDGATLVLWACEHGESNATPEGAAANCLEYCQRRERAKMVLDMLGAVILPEETE